MRDALDSPSGDPKPHDATTLTQDRARYGVTLVSAAALVVWLVAGPIDAERLYMTVANLLAGTVLVASARSARTGKRRLEASYAGMAVAAGSAVLVIAGPIGLARTLTSVVLLAVVLFVPVVVVIGLIRRRKVDLQLIMGAITIYLVLGIISAAALMVAGVLSDDPLFVIDGKSSDGNLRSTVYFAFVTISTTGYGDIAPLSGTARALAIVSALAGQLYLITAVAMAVSVFASSGTTSRE